MRVSGLLYFEVDGVSKMADTERRWCLLVGLAATTPDVFLQLACRQSAFPCAGTKLHLRSRLPSTTWRRLPPRLTFFVRSLRHACSQLAGLCHQISLDCAWLLGVASLLGAGGPSMVLTRRWARCSCEDLEGLDAPPREAVADSA